MNVMDKFNDAVGEIENLGLKVGEKGIKTVAAVGNIGVRAVENFFKTIIRDKSKKEYATKCLELKKDLSESTGDYEEIEGVLEQKSAHFTWFSRFFVLKKFFLVSYKKSKSEEKPKDKIPLNGSTISFKKDQYTFKIVTETGVEYSLRANDEETTFKWYRAISRNIQIAKTGRFTSRSQTNLTSSSTSLTSSLG
jgi:hypothetical protein